MATDDKKPENTPQAPDVEHELPTAEAAAEESAPQPQASTAAQASSTSPQVEQLNEERNALFDRLARLQAEFENSRKRAAREQQEFRESILAEAIRAMLPVLDSLDRALQAPAQNVDELRSGIELIRKQFEDALTRLGATRIPAKGQAFDPRVHEAIEMVETDSANDNQVLEELQRGYKIGDRLVRPARVRVARNPKHDSQPKAA